MQPHTALHLGQDAAELNQCRDIFLHRRAYKCWDICFWQIWSKLLAFPCHLPMGHALLGNLHHRHSYCVQFTAACLEEKYIYVTYMKPGNDSLGKLVMILKRKACIHVHTLGEISVTYSCTFCQIWAIPSKPLQVCKQASNYCNIKSTCLETALVNVLLLKPGWVDLEQLAIPMDARCEVDQYCWCILPSHPFFS